MRIIVPVEIMFKTIFVAVPALSLVDPLRISGPTTGAIKTSDTSVNSETSLQVTPSVAAPRL